MFHTVQTRAVHGHSFTHISIVRFIRNLLNINMGKDRGGLFLLDGTAYDDQGSRKCTAMSLCHALTGLDTTSQFLRH